MYKGKMYPIIWLVKDMAERQRKFQVQEFNRGVKILEEQGKLLHKALESHDA